MSTGTDPEFVKLPFGTQSHVPSCVLHTSGVVPPLDPLDEPPDEDDDDPLLDSLEPTLVVELEQATMHMIVAGIARTAIRLFPAIVVSFLSISRHPLS